MGEPLGYSVTWAPGSRWSISMASAIQEISRPTLPYDQEGNETPICFIVMAPGLLRWLRTGWYSPSTRGHSKGWCRSRSVRRQSGARPPKETCVCLLACPLSSTLMPGSPPPLHWCRAPHSFHVMPFGCPQPPSGRALRFCRQVAICFYAASTRCSPTDSHSVSTLGARPSGIRRSHGLPSSSHVDFLLPPPPSASRCMMGRCFGSLVSMWWCVHLVKRRVCM